MIFLGLRAYVVRNVKEHTDNGSIVPLGVIVAFSFWIRSKSSLHRRRPIRIAVFHACCLQDFRNKTCLGPVASSTSKCFNSNPEIRIKVIFNVQIKGQIAQFFAQIGLSKIAQVLRFQRRQRRAPSSNQGDKIETDRNVIVSVLASSEYVSNVETKILALFNYRTKIFWAFSNLRYRTCWGKF